MAGRCLGSRYAANRGEHDVNLVSVSIAGELPKGPTGKIASREIAAPADLSMR
jgi:hypothetical protein